MRFLLPLCSVIILVLALYVTTGVDIASAHSPDIRPVETSITIVVEEDEGYYNGPIVKSTDGSVRAFPTAKGGVASPAYATLPGVDAATMDLLQELRHGPEAYLESLRAEELDNVPMTKATLSRYLAAFWIFRGLPTDRLLMKGLRSISCENLPGSTRRQPSGSQSCRSCKPLGQRTSRPSGL